MPREWPIVGRDKDLAAIQAAVDNPITQGVVLVAPQGIGKSRLAREVQRRATVAGRSTAWATATRAAGTIPFGALAHLLPDDLAPLPVQRQLDLLRQADAVVDRLRRAGSSEARRPPIIVVDDAHLLDGVSATFVHHVAVQGLATLVITMRSDSVPADPITALWKDGHAERLDLVPLSRSATADLLEAVLDGRLDRLSLRRIWRTTGGNPLFLREVVHAALGNGSLSRRRGLWHWDGVLAASGRLEELVRTRLVTEDPHGHAVLELVACGEPLPVWLAECIVGRPQLEIAERAGFLDRAVDGDDPVLRFVHPVYGEVLRSAMPVSRKRETCEQLARALLDHGTRQPAELVRAAMWQLEAGTPAHRRDVSFAAAARRALQDDDPRLAERLSRAALDGERADALPILADALEKQGRHVEVVRLLQRFPDDPDGDDDPTALALAWTSNLYWADGPSSDAHVAAVSSLADPGHDPSGGEVSATDAWILFFESRLPQCVEVVRMVLGQPNTTLRARIWAATVGAAALGLRGRSGEALMVADLGSKAAEALGPAHPWGLPEVLWARVLALVTAGRLAEARHLIDPGHAPADGSEQLVGMGLGFRGLVARLQGDNPTAVTSLREAVALLDRADMYRFVRLWLAELAAALAASGDVSGGREMFDEALARDTGTNPVFDPWIALDGAWVRAAEGRLSEAVELTVRAADKAHDLGQPAFEILAAFDVARLGRPELVTERLDALVQQVDGRFGPTCRDAAKALAGRDAAVLARCSRRFEELGHQLVAAEAAAAAHSLLRAEGAPVAAAHAAERSRRLRARCPHAATPLLGQISSHLTLTPREREIAALAAAGRSSPDIAQLLDISTRTVDNHLGRAYSKLGLGGRSELRAVFGEPPS